MNANLEAELEVQKCILQSLIHQAEIRDTRFPLAQLKDALRHEQAKLELIETDKWEHYLIRNSKHGAKLGEKEDAIISGLKAEIARIAAEIACRPLEVAHADAMIETTNAEIERLEAAIAAACQ